MIEIKNLTVEYNGRKILDDISLTLAKGEKLALMGENGAGKTTLLHAIKGLLPSYKGTIAICGSDIRKDTSVQKKCALLFQNPDDQIFMPAVYQDIYFGAKNCFENEEEAEKKTEEAIKKYGLDGLRSRSVYELSGGEKRSLTLAGAMVTEPECLLLDEPFTYLDMRAKRHLIKELLQMKNSMLLVTHDISDATALCTRAVIIKNGKIYRETETKKLTEESEILRELGYTD